MDNLKFIQTVPEYLEKSEDEVILFFSIKFYRNLSGFNFPPRLEEEKFEKVKEISLPALREVIIDDRNFKEYELKELPKSSLHLLLERGLIGDNSLQVPRGFLAFESTERIAIRINEEDHLKLIERGTYDEFEEICQEAEILMGILDKKLNFAYKTGLGYLSSSPRYLGHALNISAVIHAPAVFILGQAQTFSKILQKYLIVLTGLMDTGIQTYGAFAQIQLTSFFDTTEEVANKMKSALDEIKELEMQLRNLILAERPIEIEDRISKSYAILRSCKLLTLPEAFEHLSNLRLGVDLGYIPEIHQKFFKEAFFRILPTHIKVFYGVAEDDFLKESEMRALLIQELLDKYYAS